MKLAPIAASDTVEFHKLIRDSATCLAPWMPELVARNRDLEASAFFAQDCAAKGEECGVPDFVICFRDQIAGKGSK